MRLRDVFIGLTAVAALALGGCGTEAVSPPTSVVPMAPAKTYEVDVKIKCKTGKPISPKVTSLTAKVKQEVDDWEVVGVPGDLYEVTYRCGSKSYRKSGTIKVGPDEISVTFSP